MRYRYNPYASSDLERLFPFRTDNRRPDGFWDAEDATWDNIKGTSVDPGDPVWPRWRTTPPLHGEGDFISHDPFFDIDEITQRADLYPPGRPLVDRNVDGNPASRQRVNDSDAGNLWRRRLLVHQPDGQSTFNPANGREVLFQSRNDTFSQAPNPVGKYAGEVTNLRPSSPGTVDMYLGFVPLQGEAFYHTYNILVGPNGETYEVRGGPMNSYGDQQKPSGGLAAAYDVLSNSVGPETFGSLIAADTGRALEYDKETILSVDTTSDR